MKGVRSPDAAKRNPDRYVLNVKAPDFASLHPGYALVARFATTTRSSSYTRYSPVPEPLRRPCYFVLAHPLIEIRAAWRMFRLFLHLVCGSAAIRFAKPRMSGPRLAQFKQRWSIKLLKVLGVQLRAEAVDLPVRALFVCNHISWLDVFVISAVTPAHFVCKDDIRKWPVIGWLLAATETIFIARSNRADAARTAKALAERLQRDEPVAFFPEGTTTNGTILLPFSGALFEAATLAQACVAPMTLRYLDKHGKPSTAPAYDADVTFMESLRAIVKAPSLIAELRALPEIPSGLKRREYAKITQEKIGKELDLI